MIYVRFPLSLANVEDLWAERAIDICHETVRHWWNRFGPIFAADVRRQRVSRMKGFRQWKWHLDEVYVKINGEMHYLWLAVDHEGRASSAKWRRVRIGLTAPPLTPHLPTIAAQAGDGCDMSTYLGNHDQSDFPGRDR